MVHMRAKAEELLPEVCGLLTSGAVIAAAQPKPGVHALIAVADLRDSRHEREPEKRAAKN